jgi:adenylate kinase
LAQQRTGFIHLNVGEVITQHNCYEGRDEELDTNILDEDKLLDAMEVLVNDAANAGRGIVVDFHVCEIFPERWFDLVLVLRTNTEILFDRLTQRGYGEKKRSSNMDSEIMQVILEEARASYAQEIVYEVPSNSVEDMETNISRTIQWCKQWMEDNAH